MISSEEKDIINWKVINQNYLCNKRRFGSGKVSHIAARIAETLFAREVPNRWDKFKWWMKINLQKKYITVKNIRIFLVFISYDVTVNMRNWKNVECMY